MNELEYLYSRILSNDFRNVVEPLRNHLENKPNDGRALFFLATALYKKSDFEGALAPIEKSIRLYFSDHKKHLLAAMIYRRLKRYNEAYRALLNVLTVAPEHKRSLREIEKYRNQIIRIEPDNSLLKSNGMQYTEFPSDYNQIRFFTFMIMQNFDLECRENRLFEQQLSELIKNAIRHGNKGDVDLKIRIWFKNTAPYRFIVEDQGPGFQDVEKWNHFNIERNRAIDEQDFEKVLEMARFSTEKSTDDDGGNSLFAAVQYWDEGLILNDKKNRMAVIKYDLD